ncbi:GNAT family N-acetyltransferase [Rhizobiales bacterium]|uniref:GNAT family N-acetyltransferase n=1 Tax=Hongsoonwoonella zoysiae TaxID=2821844 RepID=UPI0015618F58|nr:GNAT family N-acetyltransferase [Hongsoonwoonella zoysiae]NRG16882.1 GNAT family N-acetyltransferase [Hongsoonwoonella zoysiae]
MSDSDESKITIREVGEIDDDDRSFIFSLSERLARVAGLAWYTGDELIEFQNRYIASFLAKKPEDRLLLIAEDTGGTRRGFAGAEERPDEVTGEPTAHLSLLAVTQEAEGEGAARALVGAFEASAAEQGYRLANLAVFANNERGRAFYERLGYFNDTMTMTKPLASGNG